MERERDTTGLVFRLIGAAIILATATWYLMPHFDRKSVSASASTSTSTSTAAYGQSP